jgi:hypothetical protein
MAGSSSFARAPAPPTRLGLDALTRAVRAVCKGATWRASPLRNAFDLAQFELALRQRDIIGVWDDDEWAGAFTWENIPGWKLRLKTSKNRAAAVFTLTNYPLLFPLLEAVPPSERAGTIVKGEHGLPIRERSYRKWFRAIARAAQIPDEVWVDGQSRRCRDRGG